MSNVIIPEDFFKDLVDATNSVLETVKKMKQFKLEQLSRRDWEIVSFIDCFGIETKDALVICNYLKGDNRYTEFKINSVRRLSDGEIFCLGDEVELFGNRKITKIEVINNELLFVLDAQNKVHIGNLKKAKKKVLLTDDNVWLAYDDVVWWVAVKEEESVYCGDDLFDFGKSLVNERMFPKTKNYKYFSTEASTLDYILMNKPMLSVNDVVIMNNAKFPSTTNIEFWISLKQLAKSKMDGKK